MDNMNLFKQSEFSNKDISHDTPLADRIRPINLNEFVGQNHLVGEDKILKRIIEEDKIYSMIFWGPPGCGKTTIAKIIANKTKCRFISFSAVTAGIKQVKEVMEIAKYEKKNKQYKNNTFY